MDKASETLSIPVLKAVLLEEHRWTRAMVQDLVARVRARTPKQLTPLQAAERDPRQLGLPIAASDGADVVTEAP